MPSPTLPTHKFSLLPDNASASEVSHCISYTTILCGYPVTEKVAAPQYGPQGTLFYQVAMPEYRRHVKMARRCEYDSGLRLCELFFFRFFYPAQVHQGVDYFRPFRDIGINGVITLTDTIDDRVRFANRLPHITESTRGREILVAFRGHPLI